MPKASRCRISRAAEVPGLIGSPLPYEMRRVMIGRLGLASCAASDRRTGVGPLAARPMHSRPDTLRDALGYCMI